VTRREALKLAKLCIFLAGAVLVMMAAVDYCALRFS
jgi:hypothetical protein